MPAQDPAAAFRAFEPTRWQDAARDCDDAWTSLTRRAMGAPLAAATKPRK